MKSSNFLLVNIKSMMSGVWTVKRLRNAFIIFRMREGRGSGFIGQGWDYIRKGSDIAVFALLFGLRAHWLWYVLFGFIYMLAAYGIGYWDETKARIWQEELDMNMKRVNPFNQRLEQNIKKLQEDIEWLKKR